MLHSIYGGTACRSYYKIRESKFVSRYIPLTLVLRIIGESGKIDYEVPIFRFVG